MPIIQSQQNDIMPSNLAKIKVIGVGGGGGNAVRNMIENYMIDGVEFIAVNTDAQALAVNPAANKLQIGPLLTMGRGAGGMAAIGRKSAEESRDNIHDLVAGCDMVFVTAGMGGGTGTGAAPVIAKIAKESGALTVGVVTKPFEFEGKKRMEQALLGIEEMRDSVDTLIVIPNEKIFEIIDSKVSYKDAMKRVDDVLGQAVKSIASLVVGTGYMNVDFADVKSVMKDAGTALMGIGTAQGEDRAIEAAKLAVNSPLLDITIDGATGVLFNITGHPDDLGMVEIREAANLIKQVVDESAIIYSGTGFDESMKGTVTLTLIATGFKDEYKRSGKRVVTTNTQNNYDNQSNYGNQNNYGNHVAAPYVDNRNQVPSTPYPTNMYGSTQPRANNIAPRLAPAPNNEYAQTRQQMPPTGIPQNMPQNNYQRSDEKPQMQSNFPNVSQQRNVAPYNNVNYVNQEPLPNIPQRNPTKPTDYGDLESPAIFRR